MKKVSASGEKAIIRHKTVEAACIVKADFFKHF